MMSDGLDQPAEAQPPGTDDVHRAIEAVWRREAARLVAAIARVTRDIGIAEELAQDALVAALERWPVDGIPENPAAWLTTAARRRALDDLRRAQVLVRVREDIARELAAQEQRLGEAMEHALDQVIEDDILRLIFTACHPLIPREGRVALTLRLVGGLTTTEIARAFLVPEATVGQRISRAKRTLAEARVPFETPRGDELPGRVTSVLSVIYLIFNEGYAATSGDAWIRTTLCDEALRLGRMMTQLLPGDAEAHALTALMEFNAARTAARLGQDGEAVLLPDQDRSRWDGALIRRGMASLATAHRLGGGGGYYAVQAAITACHMRSRAAEETDWQEIVALYDVLLRVTPSPIVALNRAVAVGMADGPAAGLAAIDAIAAEPGDSPLARYHLFHSVRGDLLMKLNDLDASREATERAISLTQNQREQELLTKRLQRIAALADGRELEDRRTP